MMIDKTSDTLTNLELCTMLGWSMAELYDRRRFGLFPAPDGVLRTTRPGRKPVYWRRETIQRFLAA